MRIAALLSLLWAISLSAQPAKSITRQYDFRNGAQGWKHGFSDYANEIGTGDIDGGIRRLPKEIGTGTGYLLYGNNHSDDLWMFLTRRLGQGDGVAVNQSYMVEYRIVFASDAGTGCAGIGGAPGEAVTLKAGAATKRPDVVVIDGYRTFTADKGNQTTGGRDASVAGNVANGGPCNGPYRSITRLHQHKGIVRSSASGDLWLIVGTDSGYEGITALYYQRMSVTLTRVTE